MNEGSVNLSIGKEIVNPIVEAKIKDAIITAMGGKDELIQKVIENVLNQRVGSNGKVSQYSSDNKYSWLDIVVTEQIQVAVKEELTEQIKKSSNAIKDALIAQLTSKKGANVVASALLAGLEGTFKNSWTSKIDIAIVPPSRD